MKNNNENFFIFLSISIALHLLVIYFFLFGLPHIFDKFPEEQVIVLEMLPVSDESNVPTKKKQHEKAVENTDAKKVEQSKPDAVEKPKPTEEAQPLEETPQAPLKPTEQPKSEEKPDTQATPKEKLPVEKPKEEKKTEEKVAPKKEPVVDKIKKANKEEKKNKDTKKKIPNKSDLDSLLKNLEQSSEGNNAKSNKVARTQQSNADKESQGKYDENLPLSISEMSLIKQQIEKHWNIPIGAENLDQVRIILYIALNQDGSVTAVKIVDKKCSSVSDAICGAIADSAVRAVWQASPLQNLDPANYSKWQELKLGFDPSKM